MTSEERHEARYKRRKAKRDEAKRKRNEGHTFEAVTDFNNLRRAFYSARKGVNWKASVQRYGCNVIKNCADTSVRLRNGTYESKGFIEFDINERGKKRHISSVHISERVVQKSICDYGIVPVLEKSLIYDNSASQRGKGTDFARDRLKRHLREYYRKYGCEGYVLVGDCHDFYGSMQHEVVEENLRHLITDERLIDLTMQFVHCFPKGLGLGSQVCQINAVVYQNRIDHSIKEVKRCRWYGRYNDDFYILCRTKEEAWELLSYIRDEYLKIGIHLNPKKTQVIKLTHGFIFLQDRMYLTSTGKIIDKPSRKSIVRNRRRLKAIADRYYRCEITYDQVQNFFASHIGYLIHKDAYHARCNINKLFCDLFIRGTIHEQVCNAQ